MTVWCINAFIHLTSPRRTSSCHTELGSLAHFSKPPSTMTPALDLLRDFVPAPVELTLELQEQSERSFFSRAARASPRGRLLDQASPLQELVCDVPASPSDVRLVIHGGLDLCWLRTPSALRQHLPSSIFGISGATPAFQRFLARLRASTHGRGQRFGNAFTCEPPSREHWALPPGRLACSAPSAQVMRARAPSLLANASSSWCPNSQSCSTCLDGWLRFVTSQASPQRRVAAPLCWRWYTPG